MTLNLQKEKRWEILSIWIQILVEQNTVQKLVFFIKYVSAMAIFM